MIVFWFFFFPLFFFFPRGRLSISYAYGTPRHSPQRVHVDNNTWRAPGRVFCRRERCALAPARFHAPKSSLFLSLLSGSFSSSIRHPPTIHHRFRPKKPPFSFFLFSPNPILFEKHRTLVRVCFFPIQRAAFRLRKAIFFPHPPPHPPLPRLPRSASIWTISAEDQHGKV